MQMVDLCIGLFNYRIIVGCNFYREHIIADSDLVTAQRQNFFVGDINYKSGLSEALLRKIGSSINFINGKVLNIYPTHFSGYFRAQSTNGYQEPMIYILKNSTISWYTLSIGRTNATGDNRCNFKVIGLNGTILGDLFSTPPSINEAGLDNSVVGRDVDGSASIQQVTTTGFNLGILNPAFTNLVEGYQLRPYIVGNATDSLGMTLTLAIKLQE